MSERQRNLEQVRRAGARLVAADRERGAALQDATAALHSAAYESIDDLASCSGLSHFAVRALLSRDSLSLTALHRRRLLA